MSYVGNYPSDPLQSSTSETDDYSTSKSQFEEFDNGGVQENGTNYNYNNYRNRNQNPRDGGRGRVLCISLVGVAIFVVLIIIITIFVINILDNDDNNEKKDREDISKKNDQDILSMKVDALLRIGFHGDAMDDLSSLQRQRNEIKLKGLESELDNYQRIYDDLMTRYSVPSGDENLAQIQKDADTWEKLRKDLKKFIQTVKRRTHPLR